jgi:hypothetical protein
MAPQVESADAQRGDLAEADPGVGQEEHDESVGLVRPSVEATVFARIAG